MSTMLNQDQTEDLIKNVLNSPKITQWKGSKIQFCCPIHGESHPSMGIDLDYIPEDSTQHLQVCHCFSCGFKGSIPWLVYKADEDQYKNIEEVIDFLRDRYNVEFTFNFDEEEGITRYESLYDRKKKKVRKVLDRFELAPYKSGKETFQYFYDRGFTKATLKKYMIGRDLINETVTIPCFWEDNTLAGIIGRYIDPNRRKNERFKIYANFEKSLVLFNLNNFIPVDDTAILLESMTDSIMLDQWGITNSVAYMGVCPSKTQLDIIFERVSNIIFLHDNDTRGESTEAEDFVREYAREKGVRILNVTYPPKEKGKDPCEWGEKRTRKVIASATYLKKKLPRM